MWKGFQFFCHLVVFTNLPGTWKCALRQLNLGVPIGIQVEALGLFVMTILKCTISITLPTITRPLRKTRSVNSYLASSATSTSFSHHPRGVLCQLATPTTYEAKSQLQKASTQLKHWNTPSVYIQLYHDKILFKPSRTMYLELVNRESVIELMSNYNCWNCR